MRLPHRPSAEHLRKQAKRLARRDALSLADAQHRLARDYGARHWAELMATVESMRRGEDRLEHTPTSHDFAPLPAAANANDLDRVRELLAAGDFTPHDLDLALARAVLRFDERASIARLLVEHGADPDGQYGADYGPIVFVTGEALDVEGLVFLIEVGGDVTAPPIDTKFGPQCALSCWLGSYLRGRNLAKQRGIDVLLEHGAYLPPEVTPPLLAIHRDDAAALARELDAEPSLATRAFDALPYVELPGGQLIHYAAELGATDCLRALLDRGADANARTPAGTMPLMCAARGGAPGDARLLLDHGARGWIADEAGKTAADHARDAQANPHRDANTRLLTEIGFRDAGLARAVALLDAGEVEALATLLRAQPQLVTARVEDDSALTRGYFARPTLLHFVALNPGRPGLVGMPPRIVESTRTILDAGAEVDASTDSVGGGTTLALVASSEPAHQAGVVEPLLDLLIARGADPTLGLRAAILHRQVATTRGLLARGGRVTAVAAAGLDDVGALRALLARGVTDDERLEAGWAAAMNGAAGALDALIGAGLDVDARLPRPYAPTMLHEAAINAQRAACELLVAHGADRTLRDNQFDGTPADWARHAGHTALADWLTPVTG